MKLISHLQRRCAWINMSTATLVALLQRTPVARLVVTADEIITASPFATLLKSAAASLAALGAVDSMAGATILASSLTANPTGPLPDFNATVGTAITPLIFKITNTMNIASWTFTGQLPPGMAIQAAENPAISISGPGNLDATTPGTVDTWTGLMSGGNVTTTPVLTGTPTMAGTFTLMVQGFANPRETGGNGGAFVGTGVSAIFPFTIVVAGTQATPPPAGAPVFTVQPVSVTSNGGTVALDAVASNSPTYQWMLNGSTPVAGATSPTLLLSNSAASTGSYTLVATNSAGTATSTAATVSATSTSNFGHLINLSTRALVGTNANILIAGFAIGGSGSEPVLVRASGPALTQFAVSGIVPDPQLQVFSGSTVLNTNNGWAGDPTIMAEASAVGAFPWTTPTSHDSAVATSLAAGPYTAQVSGQSGDSGVALVEVYDATASFTPSSPRLINLSARVQVGTNANILIAGFVIGGTTSETVLIRASGPALTQFSVAGVLPDPKLQVFNSANSVVASNTVWGGDAQIASTASAVGAFAWTSASSADSAILVSLPPGAYTAQVSGASNDTGVALVEVYEVR